MQSTTKFEEELNPDTDDLLIFVDDTGHETFAGTQDFYGLGGCVMPRISYEHIKTKWRELRTIINGDPNAPLHASTMERKPENFAALSEFFSDRSFIRIAVTTTKNAGLPPEMHPCIPVMGQLREEIAIVASCVPCKRVWIIFESSERADPVVRSCFSQLTSLNVPWPLSVEHCFMPKSSNEPGRPPILAGKDYAAASVFTPSNLLREARRQKGLAAVRVPEICVLDPDGDILRRLRRSGHTQHLRSWACYHTELFAFDHEGEGFGIIGCAVGAAFAVLLAEQLFACGCQFLVSVTSAGQILARGETPYFVLIDRALRDEGTSYHYLPPSEFAAADLALAAAALEKLKGAGQRIYRGAAWTTDAPFRETEAAIRQARARGILAVEMEAAALYAFAAARRKAVLCFAHVTNRMAVTSGDFEKGEADGSAVALAVIAAASHAWRQASQVAGPC